MITLALIVISSSSVNAFAEKDWTQEQLDSGRYSEADPNGSGVGEGASSDDKEKHEHFYSYDSDSNSFTSPSVEAAIANGCECVVFRLDDLQDFWLPNVQVAVMDQFVQKNQYLSVGPIVSIFGGDPTVVDFAVDGFDSGLFEVFVHGWTHVDHTGLDLATQTSTLQSSQDKLTLIFGNPVLVFIPPYNAFNADTLTALDSGGYDIISAAEYTDSYPYFVADGSSKITDSLGLYHLPESIGFVQYGGGGPIRIPTDQVLDAIDSSIASKGYAVVTIHSQEFAEKQGGVEINSIDQNYIDDLNEVIDGILARNYPIKTFKQIVDYNQAQGSDSEKPVIYPNGYSTSIPFGSSYAELGAYVTDNDPAYSESVTIGGDTVDPFTSGDYTITYNAPADAAGNVPDEQTITITVLAQTGSNPCNPLPNSGDWIITSTCHLENDFTSPASVLVQNGAVLIIPDDVTLTILSGNNLTVESGGGTLIRSGGSLHIDS